MATEIEEPQKHRKLSHLAQGREALSDRQEIWLRVLAPNLEDLPASQMGHQETVKEKAIHPVP